MIKKNEDFVKEIAKEFDLPDYVVRDIISSPYRFLKEVMAKKELEGVMLPYFGKFVVPAKLKGFLERIEYGKATKQTGGNNWGANKQSEREGEGEGDTEKGDMQDLPS